MQPANRPFARASLAFLTALLSAAAEAGPPEYSVTAITPDSPATSIGYDLNDSGQVVGTRGTVGSRATRAFSYTPQTGITDLGVVFGTQSTAFGVNAGGQAVGMSTTTGASTLASAVVFGSPIHDLGTLGGSSSVAFGINESGEIVGQSQAVNRDFRAFTMINGVLHNIGTLDGPFSAAYAVNDRGIVTGMSDTLGGTQTHAFLYDGVMHDIGTLGGAFSVGTDINLVGHVTGGSTGPGTDAPQHAFFYDGAMHDMGTLGGALSEGLGINNQDTVVGMAQTASGDLHAFLESGGEMLDLNSLVGAGDALLTYITLTEARAINNLGEILVNGVDDRTGRESTFLLTPLSAVPLPPSAVLLLTGIGCLLAFGRLASRAV